jgi:hypothetical protein
MTTMATTITAMHLTENNVSKDTIRIIFFEEELPCSCGFFKVLYLTAQNLDFLARFTQKVQISESEKLPADMPLT